MDEGGTIRERIIAYLALHPDGADDDELAQALQLKQRQQANSRCRQLEAEGAIERRRDNGKLRNFLRASGYTPAYPEQTSSDSMQQPWFWEGNVQRAVVEYLIAQEYTILQAADTASHEHGIDIIADGPAKLLWVTVKGYPKGTPRTHPSLQAGHWFKQATFDIIVYRGENSEIDLAIALPDFPRYRKLAHKIAWFQPTARFSFIWVQQDGTISIQ